MRAPRVAVVVAACVALPVVGRAQAHPSADVAAGVGVLSRSLAYHEDLFGRFAPYDLAAAPALNVRAELYPFAARGGALGDLGLVAGGEYAFATSARTADGRERATRFWGVEAGLRWRLTRGPAEVGLSARWAWQSFGIEPSGAPQGPVTPAWAYQSVRPGVDLRVALGARVALTASLGWLFVLGYGDAGSFFPRASGHAADGALGAAVGLTGALELRAQVTARRYFLAMNPEPGDAWIVGGAVDQLLGATIALAWRR